ncbi:hypothetical protein D7D52_32900 [Nocardia yunnanensis]|uniref:Uncharacterized protein n=1 Tax=Nocardia yunnanensis TaxID=2382165 RepID=A0A386ZKL6_9NOCA|nr:hypothetical protein [Nocardia yunnanensis]AYF77823.1 hypothetical protein D7D52_32900 [Nocardia yunnanensis]
MSDPAFPDGPQRYATTRLFRALTAIERAGSAGDRERARQRARQWREVLAGLRDGRVVAGSRTPVAGLPAWVTLEVTHGGFATGRGLAEAPLTRDEEERLAAVPPEVPGESARERLNLWYLGDAGQAELLAVLRSGHYRVRVPEHAALAVVALLLDKGFAEQALDLVARLRPHFARLRFTPDFDAAARPSGAAVRVATVGEAGDALRAVRTPEQLRLMHDTVEVWTPLYDRLVALWCMTVDGDLPRIDAEGAVLGGQPGAVRPPGWLSERARWLQEFEKARGAREFRGRHAHPRSNFARLHEALLSVPDKHSRMGARLLTPQQAKRVRLALANTLTRHGEPGGGARESERAAQARAIASPLYRDLAEVLAARLDRLPADGGLPSLDPVTAPVGPEDKATVADGTDIPQHLRDKAIRALEAPPDELIRRGIIGSGEVLAAVLPQLTSRLLAAEFADPVAAGLYEQVYTAFRRRRSLLLLDLQHQVRFDELPWVTALEALRAEPPATGPGKKTGGKQRGGKKRAGKGDGRQAEHAGNPAARRLLRQMALLAIESFPETMLPNPLVREFHTLAGQAGLRLPLVEEVAADIFMGTFTEKWRTAALVASRTLEGTLYQRYYDLPTVADWEAHARNEIRWGKPTSPHFAELCAQRATEAGTGNNYVARNGALLEQSQILTTHNLAVLVDALNLEPELQETAPQLAHHTFDWILHRLSQPGNRHTQLLQLKNAAYAWRQAIFLLSYCNTATQHDQLHRLSTHHTTPLTPAINGLSHVVSGGHFTPRGMTPSGNGHRFLGWTQGRHWYFA